MLRRHKKIVSALILVLFAAGPIVLAAPQAAAPQIKSYIEKPALRSAEPKTFKLEGDISITKGNPKISLSLRESDVTQVLRMFADKAGMNIVFHSSVDGKVTLDLVNVPLNEAFKLIMQVADLTYYIDSHTMVVASAKDSMDLNMSKQQMTAIPVKYIDATAMAEFLNKNIFTINKPGLSNAEIAITNPNANEVLIFGTENDARMAKKLINKFDEKPLTETYNVNHTTPKEMADLICNLLFPSEDDNDGVTINDEDEDDDDSNTTEDIAIGTGVVACTYNPTLEAGKMTSLKTKGMSIAYFSQRGTVSVTGGSPNQLDAIREFIQKNDTKQPQAYLELSIIELNESGMKQFDNTWQIFSKYFSASFNGALKTNPALPTFFNGDKFDVLDDQGKLKYSIAQYAGAPTITYAINYLIKNDKGRVLANPRIMITNGQTSTIDMTSDYVKSVKSEILATGGLSGATQKTYEIGDDDGLKIEMIPFISPDGYVTLNIKPEYATIKQRIYAVGDTTETDIQATLLQRRNLDLKNVRIKDGETLVIGGMIREDETKGVSKLPLLGDIPVIGVVFRNSQTTKTKQELIIMMTPKIVKDTEDIVRKDSTDL